MPISTGKKQTVRRGLEYSCFATVDPGITGGVAIWVVDDHRKTCTLISADSMPIDAQLAMVDGEELAEMYGDATKVYIEKVGSMPGNAGQKMFNFGTSYGIAIGAAMAARMEVALVSPATWMNVAHNGLLRSQDSKSRSLYVCKRDLGIALAKSKDGIADAICLGIAIAKQKELEVINGIKEPRENS